MIQEKGFLKSTNQHVMLVFYLFCWMCAFNQIMSDDVTLLFS